MFERKQAAVPVIPLQRPTPRLAIVGSELLGPYEAIARELNYSPAHLLQEQLLRFLAENQIQIYDYDAVDHYLAAIAEKVGKVWVWRPLRKQDTLDWKNENGHCHWWGRAPTGETGHVTAGHGSCRANEWTYRPYHHAVPAPILWNAKKIHDEFGERVKFFVSDYAVPKPDPFIMVTAQDVDKIIFGVWDEPSFGTNN
jgi:hypothetical protein